jgi:NAD(P)-dependent dehydrogenase (short-subunit alcohol dehydrogenase family)
MEGWVMAFTANQAQFRFGPLGEAAFRGKRVLITGAGKNGGIGQALALAAAANGAKTVGVHFNASREDGFDLVAHIQRSGGDAFAVQADITNLNDLWSTRSHVIGHMQGDIPDLIICNSGLAEKGYRFGRALPTETGEGRAQRRSRVREAFLHDLAESDRVLNTKVTGFLGMSHLWAAEALYRNHPLHIVYISSMQALEPGAGVPGYVVANWAVLRLSEVMRVNLGGAAGLVETCSMVLPFVRTGMTEPFVHNTRVFGRWQARMLEPFEAAHGVTQLLARPGRELDGGCFKLQPVGEPAQLELRWSRVGIHLAEVPLADGLRVVCDGQSSALRAVGRAASVAPAAPPATSAAVLSRTAALVEH